MEQATGEFDTRFGGGNGWGNNSAPLLAPHMLEITGSTEVMMTQQAMRSGGGT